MCAFQDIFRTFLHGYYVSSDSEEKTFLPPFGRNKNVTFLHQCIKTRYELKVVILLEGTFCFTPNWTIYIIK